MIQIQITDDYLTPNMWSRPQTVLAKVKGVAIHWVGNAGSSAKGNRDYFENLKFQQVGKKEVFASSHYIVGLKGEVIRCIPESEISHCTNSRNVDTISIEMCHPDWTGKPVEATYNSLVWLLTNLCDYYSLNPLTDIIRHYDVTKKICPKWFVDYPSEFKILKELVKKKMDGDDTMIEQPNIENENLKSHWAYNQIMDCINKGLMVGYPDGTFKPDSPVSRAELSVVVSKLSKGISPIE